MKQSQDGPSFWLQRSIGPSSVGHSVGGLCKAKDDYLIY